MSIEQPYAGYDPFAWFYNRFWGTDWSQMVLPVLDGLVLGELRSGDRVLDLCCGTGQIAAVLAERGLRVTGLDGSPEMLRHAKENAPGVEFVHADARDFALPEPQDAAFSTYDSLNHIMTAEELEAVFGCVLRALKPGGRFVFDISTPDSFDKNWRTPAAIVEDDAVCVIRPSYDADAEEARWDSTMFRLEDDGRWSRSDLTLRQRCYRVEEVVKRLESAGFVDIVAHAPGPDDDVSQLRAFFVAKRPGGDE